MSKEARVICLSKHSIIILKLLAPNRFGGQGTILGGQGKILDIFLRIVRGKLDLEDREKYFKGRANT